jgi:hypothetical protein
VKHAEFSVQTSFLDESKKWTEKYDLEWRNNPDYRRLIPIILG